MKALRHLIRAAEEVWSKNFSLYGQEANGATWALARMNMFLHAKDAARIDWCNALTGPTLIEEDRLKTFDIVVANPPVSLKKWGAENTANDPHDRSWRGVPPPSKGDYAFITHMIEIAERRSGRVAVIVPHGVLFRGRGEGRIRKALIEENLLDAVIGLPEKLFTTTGIPVAILVLDRSREQGGANEDRPRGHAGRDRGERLQPEHPALRGYVRAGGGDRHCVGAAGDRRDRGGAVEVRAKEILQDRTEAAECETTRFPGGRQKWWERPTAGAENGVHRSVSGTTLGFSA